MTIKGLAEFLKNKKVPKEGRTYTPKKGIRENSQGDMSTPLYLKQLAGKRVAIETAGIIYRQNWAAIKNVLSNYPFILRETGWTKPADHEILSAFKRFFKSHAKRILDSGIIPIFIVEGKSPDMKGITAQKRAETRTSLAEKSDAYKMDIDLETFKKKLNYVYPPGPNHVQAVIDVLQEMGVSVIRAKHESEGVCAFLVNSPPEHPLHCDCALTDDYDIFMYGCRAVIRNLRSSNVQYTPDSIPGIGNNKNRNLEVEGYAFRDILYFLGFLPVDEDGKYMIVSPEEEQTAEERFRLMCILCGNDYSTNIRNLGPAKICTMIKKYDIKTYDDACKVEPRFTDIPYNKIMETIENNKDYSIIYLSSEVLPVSQVTDTISKS